MTQNNNILGIIPARAGSVGVPGKNLMKLGGVSLIGHAIKSATEANCLTRTIVTTESQSIADEARANGADVPFMRPDELATNTAGTFDVLRHAVGWLAENQNWQTDIIVLLQPTTPFRRGFHIDATVNRLLSTAAESALSIRPADYPPQWTYSLNEGGTVCPLFDGGWPKRRQDAIDAYQPSGMVYALRVNRLEADQPVNADKTAYTIVERNMAINIDEPFDLQMARALWAENAPPWASPEVGAIDA